MNAKSVAIVFFFVFTVAEILGFGIGGAITLFTSSLDDSSCDPIQEFNLIVIAISYVSIFELIAMLLYLKNQDKDVQLNNCYSCIVQMSALLSFVILETFKFSLGLPWGVHLYLHDYKDCDSSPLRELFKFGFAYYLCHAAFVIISLLYVVLALINPIGPYVCCDGVPSCNICFCGGSGFLGLCPLDSKKSQSHPEDV